SRPPGGETSIRWSNSPTISTTFGTSSRVWCEGGLTAWDAASGKGDNIVAPALGGNGPAIGNENAVAAFGAEIGGLGVDVICGALLQPGLYALFKIERAHGLDDDFVDAEPHAASADLRS